MYKLRNNKVNIIIYTRLGNQISQKKRLIEFSLRKTHKRY